MDASRLRALLLLALTFLAGAAAGIAGDRLRVAPGVVEATETVEPPDAGRGEGARQPRTTIERFADDLGLTADQRTQIEGFLDHFRTSSRMLQQAVRPQYRALMDSVRTQIESVLTEDQVEQYHELLEERYGGDERGRGEGRGDRRKAPDRGSN